MIGPDKGRGPSMLLFRKKGRVVFSRFARLWNVDEAGWKNMYFRFQIIIFKKINSIFVNPNTEFGIGRMLSIVMRWDVLKCFLCTLSHYTAHIDYIGFIGQLCLFWERSGEHFGP